MNGDANQSKARRKFLRMLAASPLLAGSRVCGGSLAKLLASNDLTAEKFLTGLQASRPSDDVISSPDQALAVLDFEPAATQGFAAAIGNRSKRVSQELARGIGRCGRR